MPTYDLSNVEVAVIDVQTNTARLLRDVLARLNIKRVELYDGFSHASQLLTGGAPDVLLVDCDGPHEADAFRFIRAFRNEPETPNPYAAIIVTTWQPTSGQVMRTTNSGADDMIVKPLSPKQLQERLHLLVEARKKFVVTADYTGPDRRKSPREGTQITLLDVPNTLRMKALGRWPVSDLKRRMDDAARQVNRQKRQRGAVQISFLLEYAAPGLAEHPPAKAAVEHVSRIPAIIEDMHRRLSGSPSPSTAEALCRNLRTISEKIRHAAEHGRIDPADLSESRRLADELMQSVDPDRSLEEMRREVATAVAGYRARLEQLTQAKQGETAPPVKTEGKESEKK